MCVSWRLACVLGFFVFAIASCGETGAPGGTGGTGGMLECASPADCQDDGNECTAALCSDGVCATTPLDDGTACDESNECTVGVCAGAICDTTAVQDGTACSEGECLDGVCAPVGAFRCTEQGIRDAVAAGGGPHFFACDGPTTVATVAEIIIDNNVILDGEGNLAVDGDEDHRVFSVSKGVTAELRGFLVTGAARRDSGPGGGIWNNGALTLTNSTVSGNIGYESGGIANSGTLTLTNSTVSGNGASQGGGITNSGTLTLTNSTVSGNRSVGETLRGAAGGGIDNIAGTLTLTNSTVSGNSSYGAGGGILNRNNGALTLTNSTVSGNSASYEGGGIANSGTLTLTNSTVSGNTAELDGGGIANFGTLTLTNTLVDNDCDGTALSGGGNLESPGNTCGLDQPTDVTEVTAEALKLAPLQDNGAPTQTHALLPGSVAIDLIPEAMCVMETDQRGVARPQGAACDVGAFELQ